MKTVEGNVWTETDTRGVLKLGFTQRYIDEVLGECFHVIPADTRVARKGQPLMVLETNDGTTRVKSPLSGTILVFAEKARNFPDRLTEDDVIVEVLPEGVKLPERAIKPKVVYQDTFAPIDWNVNPFQAQVQPPPPPVWNNFPVEQAAPTDPFPQQEEFRRRAEAAAQRIQNAAARRAQRRPR